jgi:N-acyl-D-amino-acid deacylase
MFDLIIKNGVIIDGTKNPRFQADLGLQGDRIQQIGRLDTAETRQTLNAKGKIVAPGFIDVHTHSDGWLLKLPHLLSKTSQGFTTEVIMADGISYAPVTPHTVHDWIYYLRSLNALCFEEYQGWQSLADYMALLDRRNVQNSITHIPYANLRVMAGGFGGHVPDDYQMRQIIAEVERGMEAGAVGLSTGLDYIDECLASTDELVEACKAMSPWQGLYVTHVRYKKGTLAGVKEAVEIGKRAKVPVHISHLKGTSPQESEEIIAYIDQVATQEVDFSFDIYPYIPGSTMLNYLLPYEVWSEGPLGVMPKLKRPEIRARFAYSLQNAPLDEIHIAWVLSKHNRYHQGKTLADYVAEIGLPPAEALSNLLIEENLAVLLVFHQGDDELVNPFLAHDRFMMGTDGIYHAEGAVHPRQYGSAPRLLGPCVRDKKLFSLEEAVYKLSGYPAERFGLKGRGIIQEGRCADLVIFDPETIQDRATYEDPHQFSVGVEHVLVNGVPIISNGQAVEDLALPLPGRALKFKEEQQSL